MHTNIPYFLPQCVPNKVVPKQTKMQPLDMILFKKCASHFQMDLIEIPRFQDYVYILHVMDHLSKYSYEHALKMRTLMEVGKGLISILANSGVYLTFMLSIFLFLACLIYSILFPSFFPLSFLGIVLS